MKAKKIHQTIFLTILLTAITPPTSAFTIYEDGTWTIGEPEDECYSFGTVYESYFTNPACKELGDQLLDCLEYCYTDIEARSPPELYEYPYYCDEICIPKCEELYSENDPIVKNCRELVSKNKGQEDETISFTTKTGREKLIEEECKETCKQEYGPYTTGGTDKNNTRSQNNFLGQIDECTCTCEKGKIYRNEIITKPYCGEPYDDNTNYCGPAGKFGVPRRPVGIDFNRACYNHDHCYETQTPQKTCDLNMLKDMRTACNQAAGFKRFICLGFARIYYHAVSTLGSIIGTKT